MEGIIYKALSGFYYVNSPDGIYECKARGNFRSSGISPLVGDRVEFSSLQNGKGIVTSVLPRKNFLVRPAVSNVDKLFIVSSHNTPSPDLLMIDRLTALAAFVGIESIIVFNKCDLGDFEEYSAIYKNAGFKTYCVSASENYGIDALKAEIAGSVCAFAGNSGVGKSSIINALSKELSLQTGEVSTKLGRGKHTTRHTELFSVCGGYVIDTPGFAAIECEKKYEFKENLVNCFPDFSDCIDNCKFVGCSHTCEPHCALIDAVNSGKVQKTRYESYKKLFDELKDIKEWQR